jgi:hypothetical protein
MIPENADLFSMGEAAGEAVKDLVTQHWQMIEGIMAVSHKKQSVAISLTFRPTGPGCYNLKTKIRFAEVQSDEREDNVGGDPKQTKLGIEDIKGGNIK